MISFERQASPSLHNTEILTYPVVQFSGTTIEVRDLLGHSTVKMTEKYAHLAPDNVRAAVAVLEGESRSSHGGKRKGLTVIG